MVSERGDASATARVTCQSIYTLAVVLVHDCAANVLEDDPLVALITRHCWPHGIQGTSMLACVWRSLQVVSRRSDGLRDLHWRFCLSTEDLFEVLSSTEIAVTPLFHRFIAP